MNEATNTDDKRSLTEYMKTFSDAFFSYRKWVTAFWLRAF